jgi:hypothetical protein
MYNYYVRQLQGSPDTIMINNDDQSTSNVSCLASPASRAGDIQSASNGDLNDTSGDDTSGYTTSGNFNDTSGDDMSGNLNDTRGDDTIGNLNDTSGNDTSSNLNDMSGDDTSGNLNDTSGDNMRSNLNDMSGDLSESTSNLSGSNVMLSDSVAAPESHDSDDIMDTNVYGAMEQMSSSSLGGWPKGTTNEAKAESLVNTKNWCAVK